ncbi:metallophosphoesterase [Candidatus Woesearchaeota archaeon]|nr:metallophosphoesterase [Candidatus Woesearchaeota archaeon]
MKLTICANIYDDLESLVKLTKKAQGDYILIAGDLCLRPYTRRQLETLWNGFIEAKRQHVQKTYTEMKQALGNKPYFVIPGNYDSDIDIEAVFKDKNLHKKSSTIGSSTITGYGGALENPPHIKLLEKLGDIEQFKDYDIHKFLEETTTDILITHEAPEDDNHIGSQAITQYIETNQPRLVICGNTQEAIPSSKQYKKTTVVNPGNLGKFELINPHDLKTITSFDHGTYAEIDFEDEIKVDFYSI